MLRIRVVIPVTTLVLRAFMDVICGMAGNGWVGEWVLLMFLCFPSLPNN